MSGKPKRRTKAETLIAAIQRKAPIAAPLEPDAPEPIAAEARPQSTRQHHTNALSKSRAGQPVQFWLHDEDRKLVRELAAWLAGQGLRPTDSMVIRAALRTAKTGGQLLEAYRQASRLDGRLKQHRTT